MGEIKAVEGMAMTNGFWNGRNVFVTGATGLIGSWLVKALIERGANVVALMRDYVPDSELVLSGKMERVSLVYGRLEDPETLVRAFNEYEIHTCFHLGAQTIVQTANRSPLSTFESNVRGTWNLLETVRQSSLIEGIIVASSDKAYGDSDRLPYTEDMPLKGSNLYDVSKVCTDMIAASYQRTYGMPLAISRCGNIYGGGDLNFNRIVPGTIRSILNNEQPLIRSDGTPIRDYLYIKDAVSAFLALGEKAGSVSGEAFNFGTGRRLSVIEMVKKITGIMGSTLEPKILNEAKNEIDRQYLSSKKAGDILGWKASYEVSAALPETVDWYRNFLKK